MLVLKVPEEVFYVSQHRITTSSNTGYIAVSFNIDFTVKKSFEGFCIIVQFEESFMSKYSKKSSKLLFLLHLGMSIRTSRRR